MNDFHFSGVSSSAKMASTGHAGTHAPQSMHSSGWMYSISVPSNPGSSFRGWIQSTGHTSTHAASLVPMQGSQMMYATVVSRQPGKYNSERRLRRVAAALALLGTVLASLQAAPAWREAPEYLPLFAPVAPRSAAFTMRVADADLDAVLSLLQEDPGLLRGPGAWQVRLVAPADAFGKGGTYDRWKLARLYGGERPRVARGARSDGGRVIEAWTLISPYPDPTLQRLERGTLLIVLRLP
jgi:hypothetical protein